MSGEFQKFSMRNASVYSGRNAQLHEFLTRRQLALLDRNDALREEIDSLEKLQAYTSQDHRLSRWLAQAL